MKRTPIAQLERQLCVRIRREGAYLLFTKPNGRVLFQVGASDLFDANGNRFEDKDGGLIG